MFKKAQELGFTDAEIGCLRAIYDQRAVSEANSTHPDMAIMQLHKPNERKS
jgi:hypothetical protein